MELNHPTNSAKATNLIAASAQLITILLPAAFALGFAYTIGYFYAINCSWAVPLLNFQEVLSFSITSIIPISLGAIITFQMKLQDSSGNKILKNVFYLYISTLAFGILYCAYTGESYLSTLIYYTCTFFLSIFGVYVAQSYFHVTNNETFEIKASAIIVLGGLALIGAASGGLGYAKGHSQILNIDKKFAKLSGGYVFGNLEKEYLVTKVDGKYLILKIDNASITFALKESLSKYSISPGDQQYF